MERLQMKLVDLGIDWPPKVAFRKAFTSLCMSKEQQTLVRAALEMSPQQDSLRELKRVTIKLFGNQSQDMEDVWQMGDNADEDMESDEVEWELHAARSITSKPRGGAMRKSIKSTQNLYGMKGPSKATANLIWTFRCVETADKKDTGGVIAPTSLKSQ